MTRRRFLDAGAPAARGPRLVGLGRDRARRGQHRRRRARGSAATVGDPPGPAAWAPFAFDWDAPAGEHVLCARAHDATGRSQPAAPPWNVGGYANNALQRIPVTVRA